MRQLLPLLIFALAGCIMVREGNNEIKNWPIQPVSTKKSISIGITKDPEPVGKGESSSKERSVVFQEQIIKAYELSGLFSRVTVGSDPADLKAEIVISGDEGKSNGFLRVLNGITLALIPDRIEYSPTLETVYTDSKGNRLTEITKKEDVSVWIEFFLLFAMPFVDSPSTVAEAVYYDLNRATIEEALAKGVF